MRWRRSTRKAPASRRTWRRRCGCCRRPRSPTMSTPRSNMRSRFITAPARRGTSRRRWRCCARPPGRTAPIAQNRLARVLVSGQGAPMDKVEGLKWHLVAKTAGKGDPELDEELAKLSPRTAPRPRRGRTQMARRPPNDALTPPYPKGNQCRAPAAALAPFPLLRHKPSLMLHSALINVMVKAARRAGRSLKRDLGEIEQSAGVAEGAGEFRLARRQARRGDALHRSRQGAAGLRLHRRGRRHARGQPTRATPGSSIRSTAPPISCTAFRNLRSRSGWRARARSSPA